MHSPCSRSLLRTYELHVFFHGGERGPLNSPQKTPRQGKEGRSQPRTARPTSAEVVFGQTEDLADPRKISQNRIERAPILQQP